MGFDRLREDVWRANIALDYAGLVVMTWGNASGHDSDEAVVGIKSSGVDYNTLRPEDIVIVSLSNGEIIEGTAKPSSDLPIHLSLYRAFPSIGGIVHTHSSYATSWAQSCREIPCLGTTHADKFRGSVPLTRALSDEEIREAYEINTGRVIVEYLTNEKKDIYNCPAILVPHHGPFVWGYDVSDAVENAIVLEEVAKMALHTVILNRDVGMPLNLLNKHFQRKHGPNAYYGQKKTKS